MPREQRERATDGADDGARRDRRAGVLVEVAAVLAHLPGRQWGLAGDLPVKRLIQSDLRASMKSPSPGVSRCATPHAEHGPSGAIATSRRMAPE